MASREPTKPPFPSGNYKSEAELQWEADRREVRDKSKHELFVSPGCTVPQDGGNGPTLHAGDKVDPDRIQGGMPQVRRWISDGYITETDERRAKTNRGEYEFITTKAFTSGGRIYVPGEGFDAVELDQPGTDGFQTVGPSGKIVSHEGRDPVDGAELAEQVIKRELAKRATLRKKVTAAVKKRLAAAKAAESGA